MIELIVYLFLGAAAGVLGGLLGVGGGLVIVPVLATVLSHQGLAPELVMRMALGTSLATIIFTSLSSVRAHHARGAVEWGIAFRLAPGIVLGALVGASIAHRLNGNALHVIFGLFALAVAGQMALGADPRPHRRLPGLVGTAAAGGVIGVLSAIVGIGGGSLTVPFLVYCNVAMRNAVATSAASGLPVALAGAAGYAWNGWAVSGRPDWSFGYVYLPALAGIALASILSAPLGARLAHSLPANRLRGIFAVLLAFFGVRMLSA